MSSSHITGLQTGFGSLRAKQDQLHFLRSLAFLCAGLNLTQSILGTQTSACAEGLPGTGHQGCTCLKSEL